MRHLQTPSRVIVFARPRRAFVEHHRDIAPERGLDLHRDLRRDERRRTIDVVLKIDALFRDLAQLRQRENLVTAAVGQDRPIPIHEPMQSAEFSNHVEPRPNEQMIRVPENDLRLQLNQLARADRFHAPLRPHRHKRRRLDHAVRGGEPPASGLRSVVPGEQLKHVAHLGSYRLTRNW